MKVETTVVKDVRLVVKNYDDVAYIGIASEDTGELYPGNYLLRISSAGVKRMSGANAARDIFPLDRRGRIKLSGE